MLYSDIWHYYFGDAFFYFDVLTAAHLAMIYHFL